MLEYRELRTAHIYQRSEDVISKDARLGDKKLLRTMMLLVTVMSEAALCRAVATPSLRSFLFILMVQSQGCTATPSSDTLPQ